MFLILLIKLNFFIIGIYFAKGLSSRLLKKPRLIEEQATRILILTFKFRSSLRAVGPTLRPGGGTGSWAGTLNYFRYAKEIQEKTSGGGIQCATSMDLP